MIQTTSTMSRNIITITKTTKPKPRSNPQTTKVVTETISKDTHDKNHGFNRKTTPTTQTRNPVLTIRKETHLEALTEKAKTNPIFKVCQIL